MVVCLVPQEHVQRQSDGFIVILNGIVEVVSLVPQGNVQRQSDEHSVDFPVPQNREEIDDVLFLVLRKHVQQQPDELFVDILFPQVWEEIVGMVRWVPQERGQRIIEHFVDMPVPQFSQRTVEQVPVRQILEEAVEVVHFGLPEARATAGCGVCITDDRGSGGPDRTS